MLRTCCILFYLKEQREKLLEAGGRSENYQIMEQLRDRTSIQTQIHLISNCEHFQIQTVGVISLSNKVAKTSRVEMWSSNCLCNGTTLRVLEIWQMPVGCARSFSWFVQGSTCICKCQSQSLWPLSHLYQIGWLYIYIHYILELPAIKGNTKSIWKSN